MKKAYLYSLLIVICASFFFALFSLPTVAVTIYDEDFEGLVAGNLAGQDSWVKYNNEPDIGVSVVDSTNNYALATTTLDAGYTDENHYRDWTATSSGSVCFDARFNTSYIYTEIIYGAGNYVAFAPCSDDPDTTCLYSRSEETILPSMGYWYNVCVNFDCTTDTVDVFLEGDLIVADQAMVTPCTTFFRFSISPVPYGEQLFLLDNIVVTDTQQEDEEHNVDPIVPFDLAGEVYVGSLSSNIPYQINCFLDQTDCQIWLNYSFDVVGDTAYLLPYVPGGDNDPSTAIASSTLTEKLILKEYWDLPTQSTATTTKYCVYIDDDDIIADNDTQLCYTIVYWTDADDLGLPVYDISTACDDVSTSTGDMWDDFRYGIECGFRKVVYWSFTPQPENIQKINENLEDIKYKFPFSVYTEYRANYEAISEYQGQALSVPVLIWQDKNMSEPEIKASVELSTTTLMQYVDEDFYDNYYLYAQIILYFAAAIYIFFRILSLTHKEI